MDSERVVASRKLWSEALLSGGFVRGVNRVAVPTLSNRGCGKNGTVSVTEIPVGELDATNRTRAHKPVIPGVESFQEKHGKISQSYWHRSHQLGILSESLDRTFIFVARGMQFFFRVSNTLKDFEKRLSIVNSAERLITVKDLWQAFGLAQAPMTEHPLAPNYPTHFEPAPCWRIRVGEFVSANS